MRFIWITIIVFVIGLIVASLNIPTPRWNQSLLWGIILIALFVALIIDMLWSSTFPSVEERKRRKESEAYWKMLRGFFEFWEGLEHLSRGEETRKPKKKKKGISGWIWIVVILIVCILLMYAFGSPPAPPSRFY